jgi:hypothetical protein
MAFLLQWLGMKAKIATERLVGSKFFGQEFRKPRIQSKRLLLDQPNRAEQLMLGVD